MRIFINTDILYHLARFILFVSPCEKDRQLHARVLDVKLATFTGEYIAYHKSALLSHLTILLNRNSKKYACTHIHVLAIKIGCGRWSKLLGFFFLWSVCKASEANNSKVAVSSKWQKYYPMKAIDFNSPYKLATITVLVCYFLNCLILTWHYVMW